MFLGVLCPFLFLQRPMGNVPTLFVFPLLPQVACEGDKLKCERVYSSRSSRKDKLKAHMRTLRA